MEKTTNVILACDESGAKGYANLREQYDGEVGVFAGILISEEIEAEAQPEFQRIYNRYKPTTGKLHIADLRPDQQQALRQDVYTAIRRLNLPCFWYAIHVEGLHDSYLKEKEFLEKVRQEALKADPQPQIKRGSPRDEPRSLHEELFVGLYAHLIAFLEEQYQKEVSIEVRTDQIDSPIVKNFKELAKRLLDETPDLKTVTGYDTVTECVVEGAIQITATLPPSQDIEVMVRSLKITPISDGDGYVLAADVLVNSLYHLFKNRDQSELYKPLNKPTAIRDHPIADHLASVFSDWGRDNLMGDKLFRHPKGRGL